MSAPRTTRAAILKAIACQHLDLVQGEGYLYFVFDDEARNLFETHSVYTPRLNDLSAEAWIQEGRDFVAKMEGSHNAA